MQDLIIQFLNWWYPTGDTFFIKDSLIITLSIGLASYLAFVGKISYDNGIDDMDDVTMMFGLIPFLWTICSFAFWLFMPIIVPLAIIAGACFGLSKLGEYNRNK